MERNIRRDPTAKEELLLRTGELVVPVVFVGEQAVVGWDQDELARALAG